jgi:hypothetical protein
VFGTAAAEFTPLGDPDGLLIVVRQGRPWFPPRPSPRRWALLLSPSSWQAARSHWRLPRTAKSRRPIPIARSCMVAIARRARTRGSGGAAGPAGEVADQKAYIRVPTIAGG